MAGRSVKQILALDIDDIARMQGAEGRRELSKIVSQLASAANKRLREIESKNGTDSLAYKALERSWAKKNKESTIASGVGKKQFDFSVSGKDLNALRSEFIRAKGFLTNQTSTITGWNKFVKDTAKRISEGDKEREKLLQSSDIRNKLWRIYNIVQEKNPDLVNKISSTRVQELIAQKIESDPYESTDSIVSSITDYLQEESEKEARRYAEEDEGPSDFFDIE